MRWRGGTEALNSQSLASFKPCTSAPLAQGPASSHGPLEPPRSAEETNPCLSWALRRLGGREPQGFLLWQGGSSPRERPDRLGFRSHCVPELANAESILFLLLFYFDETQDPTRGSHPLSFTRCISLAPVPPFSYVFKELGKSSHREEVRQADLVSG